ncbi:hypothetical protein MAR_004370 [Mya arenaria]|uniref:Uncharacterized protein n=1 Tax=Mya arenaria TaxID=6604 RepID=A0ABY7EWM7_MYAAR|nr:hypothetical protein MAR_004370 [Mya arenaria]
MGCLFLKKSIQNRTLIKLLSCIVFEMNGMNSDLHIIRYFWHNLKKFMANILDGRNDEIKLDKMPSSFSPQLFQNAMVPGAYIDNPRGIYRWYRDIYRQSQGHIEMVPGAYIDNPRGIYRWYIYIDDGAWGIYGQSQGHKSIVPGACIDSPKGILYRWYRGHIIDSPKGI